MDGRDVALSPFLKVFPQRTTDLARCAPERPKRDGDDDRDDNEPTEDPTPHWLRRGVPGGRREDHEQAQEYKGERWEPDDPAGDAERDRFPVKDVDAREKCLGPPVSVRSEKCEGLTYDNEQGRRSTREAHPNPTRAVIRAPHGPESTSSVDHFPDETRYTEQVQRGEEERQSLGRFQRFRRRCFRAGEGKRGRSEEREKRSKDGIG